MIFLYVIKKKVSLLIVWSIKFDAEKNARKQIVDYSRLNSNRCNKFSVCMNPEIIVEYIFAILRIVTNSFHPIGFDVKSRIYKFRLLLYLDDLRWNTGCFKTILNYYMDYCQLLCVLRLGIIIYTPGVFCVMTPLSTISVAW